MGPQVVTVTFGFEAGAISWHCLCHIAVSGFTLCQAILVRA